MRIATKGSPGNILSFADERGSSSFAVVKDMREWWAVYGPQIVNLYGRARWIVFLVHAHDKLEGLGMQLSRVMRNKPSWDTSGWSEDEWSSTLWAACKAKAWFTNNCPDLRDVPEFAQYILVAQYGMFGLMERLAREVNEIQNEGHLLINMTDRNTGGIAPELVEED